MYFSAIDGTPFHIIEGRFMWKWRIMISTFCGCFPNLIIFKNRRRNIIIDYVDGNKLNTNLDNLVLLTLKEKLDRKKTDTFSFISFFEKEYEMSFESRQDAIDFLKDEGWDASIEEIEKNIKNCNEDKLYDRTWMYGHIEDRE